jgi:hypothetical protein
MAYDAPILEVPEGLAEALPDMISKAMSHAEEAFAKVQEEMTEFYKGELPGITQEELDDGRSDIVSRDVHDAFMATAPDLMRIFTGPEKLVEFKPGGPEDAQIAPQATEAVRYILEDENDYFMLVHGSVKDGLIRKFAVAQWYHEMLDKSYIESYTLQEDVFALFMQELGEEGEIVQAKSYTRRGKVYVKAKVRHIRHEHKYCVDLVPPEEIIISPSARGARGDKLIGRRQNLRKEELIAMGYDEKLVNDLFGSDGQLATAAQAAARNPVGETTTEPGDEDNLLYVESFIEWPHEDRVQLFKVCTAGTGHEIIGCEPVDEVNMALWTPDPEPHTPVGESQAEKMKDIQRLKTGVWRGIIDSLAEALTPRMEVVEGIVNIEDAMSAEIGGLIRTRRENTVRPVSTPFVGQGAIPLLDSIDNMREERVGAFRAADGLSQETMQSSTKMAVAATISGSKAQKELLARIYAWMFLRPIYKGLLKLFVQHQDAERMMQLRGQWVPVNPAGWNADMDCKVVNLTQAMLTPEEKAMQLGGIAEKQEQILQVMGPNNPIVSLGMYADTLREMVELTGRTNIDKYFRKVDPNFQVPETGEPEDPAMVLANAQATSLQQESERKDAETARKADQEDRRLDLERDKLDQTRGLELLKLAAQFGVNTQQTEAKIIADIMKNRDALAAKERMGAADRDMKASQAERDRVARLADSDANRDHQGQQADRDRVAQGIQQEDQLAFQGAQADADRTVKDQQHQRTVQTQEKIAAKKAAQPRPSKGKK